MFSNYVSKQSKCLENPGNVWNIERTHTWYHLMWKDSNRPRSLDARIVWEKWSPPTHLFLQGFRYLSFQETALTTPNFTAIGTVLGTFRPKILTKSERMPHVFKLLGWHGMAKCSRCEMRLKVYVYNYNAHIWWHMYNTIVCILQVCMQCCRCVCLIPLGSMQICVHVFPHVYSGIHLYDLVCL